MQWSETTKYKQIKVNFFIKLLKKGRIERPSGYKRHIPVLIWSYTGELPELSHEVLVVIVTAFVSDSGKAHGGSQQEVFCKGYASLYNVLMEADGEHLLISCPEMTVAELEVPAGLLSVPVLTGTAVHGISQLGVSSVLQAAEGNSKELSLFKNILRKGGEYFFRVSSGGRIDA